MEIFPKIWSSFSSFLIERNFNVGSLSMKKGAFFCVKTILYSSDTEVVIITQTVQKFDVARNVFVNLPTLPSPR